ncbi:23S rRNA (guanine(745)-N(1))-methyltransferase [Agaribacterium sp. ZY112]|uniref:23S rRNA (guanine(745)-N(1))-methyltransferase n=1 Tax=Agaribacterium sp. ZY112 TaxID=3233574 RepID=UPI0035249E32
MNYRCPLCQQTLSLQDRSFRCDNNHCFDIAKEGYVNLLPVQNKKSKSPGDSPAMMQSRRRFLQSGFYQNFAGAQQELLKKHRSEKINRIIDIGCGEAYYLEQLQNTFTDASLHGIDIAKSGARLSAKQLPNAHISVASAYSLPYFDNDFDIALSVFSPLDEQECARILKTNGLLLTAGPGPLHLKQLAAQVYNTVQEHKGMGLALNDTFELLEQKQIGYKISVNGEQALDLLTMTPYYWSCSEEKKQALLKKQNLEITLDFDLNLYKPRTD